MYLFIGLSGSSYFLDCLGGKPRRAGSLLALLTWEPGNNAWLVHSRCLTPISGLTDSFSLATCSQFLQPSPGTWFLAGPCTSPLLLVWARLDRWQGESPNGGVSFLCPAGHAASVSRHGRSSAPWLLVKLSGVSCVKHIGCQAPGCLLVRRVWSLSLRFNRSLQELDTYATSTPELRLVE